MQKKPKNDSFQLIPTVKKTQNVLEMEQQQLAELDFLLEESFDDSVSNSS